MAITECNPRCVGGGQLFVGGDMSSWFHLSHKSQLITTAIGASVLTASLLVAYDTHSRRTKRKQLDREIKRSIAAHDSLRRLPEPNKDEDEVAELPTCDDDEDIILDPSGL